MLVNRKARQCTQWGIQQGLDLEHLIREGSEKSEEGNLKLC